MSSRVVAVARAFAARGPAAALRRRLRRALPLVFGLGLTAALLYEHLTLVQSQEALARDVQTGLRAALYGARRGSGVVVVEINDLEYDTLFGGRSPLDVAVLQRLLTAVASGRPRLIGVDLDTSHPSFRALHTPGGARVVWARTAETLCACRARDPLCKAPVLARPRAGGGMTQYRHCTDGESGKLVALDFLGGHNRGAAGMAALPNDADAVIRRYERWIATADGAMSSFPWTIARLADSALQRVPRARASEFYIHYQPLRADARFTAEEILGFARNPRYDVLRDKVVVLGGTYSAGRDRYPTPLGELPGVEIHAQVVETELRRDGIRPLSGFWLLSVLVLSSAGLLLLFQRHSIDRAFRRAVLFWIPVGATAGSWIASGSPLALWPYLVPTLTIILMHQMREALLDRQSEHLTRILSSDRGEEGVSGDKRRR